MNFEREEMKNSTKLNFTTDHSVIRSFSHSVIDKARQGFSLVEMLVVMGILAILIGVGLTTFSSATAKAQKAKGQELVSNVATAIESIYQKDGCFPRRILAASNSDGGLDADVAYDIAKRNLMTLSYDKDTKKTTAADRCGIVSPWAQDVIKGKKGSGVGDGTRVPSGGMIADHRLRFAVDTEGTGFVTANVGGQSVKIRGSVAVWCCGRDGKLERYDTGRRSDDIYSWSHNQVEK